MFTLCHHIIVQISAMRAGLTVPFKDYALLGDDIVLTNKDVVENYKALIHSVGGSFSETKTHTSLNAYEFAKR